MKMPAILGAAAIALSLSCSPKAARAQDAYPSRPISLLVGYAAGGSADFTARLVGERLGKVLGQPVIVNNVPGAAQNLAAGALAKAAGDGYTLLLAGTSLSINPALYHKLPYDLTKDFRAVGGVVSVPLVVVTRKDAPFDDVAGLVAAARSRPGALNYGSSGNGSLTNLSVEIFKSRAGIAMTHVPYRGSAPMLTDLMGGQIDLAFDVMSSAYPLIRSDKLKALAVTSGHRMRTAPNVPTLDESGFAGLGLVSWYGILAPRSTPDKVVTELNGALQKVLADSQLKDLLDASGSSALPSTPEAFQAFFDAESRKWSSEARRLGLKLD